MIFLIRHGEDDNTRLGGWSDAGLSSVVIFLLSDLSDYMTGANVFADGGYHIQK